MVGGETTATIRSFCIINNELIGGTIIHFSAIYNFDESPSNITVSSDASRSVIRFTCHVDSIPEAIITWQKDGVVVPNNKRYDFVTTLAVQ